MTMAFFNSSSPAYTTATSPTAVAYAPSAPSSGVASLFGSLVGGTTPAYKTLAGQAGQAPTSSGLLQIFVGSAPSYKTAPPVTNTELADDDGGDADDTDDGSASCPLPTDTVVVL
jgi:hypothetical protein